MSFLDDVSLQLVWFSRILEFPHFRRHTLLTVMEYIGVRAVRAFGKSNERMSTTSFAATVAQRGEKVQCLHNVLGQFHPTAANISELGCANIGDTSQYVLEEWAKRWTCFDKQQPGRVITLKAVTSETSSIKKSLQLL